MLNIDWSSLSRYFRPDGSLRDIYVKNVELRDWNGFLDLAREYRHDYTDGEKTKKLPRNVDGSFFEHQRPKLLVVDLDGVRLACHFFVANEIELDFDPRETNTLERLQLVLDFTKRLVSVTKKAVLITPENSEDLPILAVRPDSLAIEYVYKPPPLQGA